MLSAGTICSRSLSKATWLQLVSRLSAGSSSWSVLHIVQRGSAPCRRSKSTNSPSHCFCMSTVFPICPGIATLTRRCICRYASPSHACQVVRRHHFNSALSSCELKGYRQLRKAGHFWVYALGLHPNSITQRYNTRSGFRISTLVVAWRSSPRRSGPK